MSFYLPFLQINASQITGIKMVVDYWEPVPYMLKVYQYCMNFRTYTGNISVFIKKIFMKLLHVQNIITNHKIGKQALDKSSCDFALRYCKVFINKKSKKIKILIQDQLISLLSWNIFVFVFSEMIKNQHDYIIFLHVCLDLLLGCISV